MVNIIKTPLNENQKKHLDMVLNSTELVKNATLCVVEGTMVKMIEIEMLNGNQESFYPNEETLDFILNGIKLERNAK